MKKLLLLFVCLALTSCLMAQQRLEVAKKGIAKQKFEHVIHGDIKTVTLNNGMIAVLCEDHSKPQIWGAVCVHAGGKNDPSDNTGMAHYLEHLMFKGTNQIGTIDWKAEKELLNQISLLYDKLHNTKDENERNNILMEINNLSQDATQYAIPNEVDVILSKMGGQGVNAFTSNDVTVYLNGFPSTQLKKWLDVYTERFRYPVFRLFQSELEAVYEEYNMYQDQPVSVFMEDALAKAYENHPYGRPVIGYQKHLKNPQISAMQQFFNTYYHPNNMTLVLVGDFDKEAIVPLLNTTIGSYQNECENASKQTTDRMHTELNMDVKPFKGHQVETVKETPVKMGIIGFRTLGSTNRDDFYLDILSNFLNNSEETGFLDRLSKENKLLGANAFNYAMLEHGMFAFFYVPKILGQSHENAESLIFAAIDSLKTGHFSDQFFEAVKMSFLKDYLNDLETLESKFNLVLSAVTSNQDPMIVFKREQFIRGLKKADIVNLANRYFNDDCLIFRSEMGTKQQEKLQKPNWKPIVSANTEKSSDFAKMIEQEPVMDSRIQILDFKNDVSEVKISDNVTLLGCKNPYNDYFTLKIAYNYGNLNDKLFATAVKYVNGQGTSNKSFNEFQLLLQQLGATMDIYSTDDQMFVSISGFDNDIEKILSLCSEKLYKPGNDEKMLQTIIEDKIGEDKMMKDDASEWGRALYYYALYGENSPYLTGLTAKELKKLSGKQLLKSFENALPFYTCITYTGNIEAKKVATFLREHLDLEQSKENKRLIRPVKNYDQPTIYIASNSKFLQSNIYYYKNGQPLSDLWERTACALYNEYMGGSMAGVVFQEIRELRSLGYSAYAAYQYDKLNRRPGFLMGYLGTQTDKTLDGCQAMSDLLNKFPYKPEKFEMAKTSYLRSIESDHITARNIPDQIRSWQEQGYKMDPRKKIIELVQNSQINDIVEFYNQTIGESPLVITIAGDKSRIDLKQLAKNYKIVELKYKDFIKE